jgi:hypothetical protein
MERCQSWWAGTATPLHNAPVAGATATSRSVRDPEELGRLLGVMRRTAEQAGRDPDAIELTALGSGRPEIVVRLAELGFTRMVMFLPEPTPHGIDRLWEKVRGVQQAAGL